MPKINLCLDSSFNNLSKFCFLRYLDAAPNDPTPGMTILSIFLKSDKFETTTTSALAFWKALITEFILHVL